MPCTKCVVGSRETGSASAQCGFLDELRRRDNGLGREGPQMLVLGCTALGGHDYAAKAVSQPQCCTGAGGVEARIPYGLSRVGVIVYQVSKSLKQDKYGQSGVVMHMIRSMLDRWQDDVQLRGRQPHSCPVLGRTDGVVVSCFAMGKTSLKRVRNTKYSQYLGNAQVPTARSTTHVIGRTGVRDCHFGSVLESIRTSSPSALFSNFSHSRSRLASPRRKASSEHDLGHKPSVPTPLAAPTTVHLGPYDYPEAGTWRTFVCTPCPRSSIQDAGTRIPPHLKLYTKYIHTAWQVMKFTSHRAQYGGVPIHLGS